jgi:Holliday junction resolvase
MEELRSHGWFCFKVHGSEHMMAGLPDVIVCAEGLFIGLETKMPEKRSHTSARQDYVHGLIREAGGFTQVATTTEEAVRAVHLALIRRG